jgi:hypothetical protein
MIPVVLLLLLLLVARTSTPTMHTLSDLLTPSPRGQHPGTTVAA